MKPINKQAQDFLIKSSITVASRKNAPTPKLMKKIVPKAPVDHSEIDEDQ